MKKFIYLIFLVSLIIICFWIYTSITYSTTNAWNVFLYFINRTIHPHKSMTQETFMFLPYWRIADVKYAKFDLLSEINYFSLTIGKDGNIVKITGRETDPGWLVWNNQNIKNLIAQTQINEGRFSLTFASQKNSIIESVLTDKSAQNNLIKSIIEQIKSRHLNGIVIDFEYDGNPDESLRNSFSDFATRLSESLKRETPDTKLYLTIIPLAGREPGLFDLKKLVNIFDKFIGMSYDYYSLSSSVAGPVAPMHGFKENKFFFDVDTTYQDYLKTIPRGKILMGVPYYGNDWAVKEGKKIQSPVLPIDNPNNYSAVISYSRMREDPNIKQNQCTWDNFAQEEWCWYINNKQIQHQVWLENNSSIAQKFNYAKKNNFSGIAIWVLGYDKYYPDLWNLILQNFTIKS